MTDGKSMVDELIAERKIEEFRENIQDLLQLNSNDQAFRRVAARSYVSLVGVWGLSESEAAQLLNISDSTYRAWQRDHSESIGPEELEKISCLLGMYKYLCTLYSGHADRVDRWMCRVNDGAIYGAKTPFQLLAASNASVFHLVRRELASWTV